MSVFSGTRKWVYAKRIAGRFQTLHRLSGVALIGALFIGPWLQVDGRPAILADVPARRFYLLGHVFTASDGFLMVLGALLAAFGLFLASALLGRLWCGYLCPQTVFLEEWVRRVEHLFEGDASARRRRDSGPWTLERAGRKTGKVLTLAALAVALGMTVISYFGEARLMWTGNGSATAYTMVGIISAGALTDWLWFREQLCIYLCPYARFQSVLTDDYSLTVSFDTSVPIQKGRAGVESGACIDCGKCVQVCPQGIDIRNGFQLECINCARCVDACTDVMDRLDRPSLVNYTTIALQEGRPQKTLRPRVVAYAALITGIAAVLVGTLVLHNPIEVTLHRAPGTLYQLDDEVVRNTYLLRVVNNDGNQARDFDLRVEGIEGATVNTPALHLGPEEARTVPLVVSAPRVGMASTVPLVVTLMGGEKPVVLETTFKAPGGT